MASLNPFLYDESKVERSEVSTNTGLRNFESPGRLSELTKSTGYL